MQKGTDAAVMVTGDFLLCQKKNVIIARCSSLHRTSALLVSALTDKSGNRCLMREPPQYFCEVISKTLNFVANSESSCTALIICLSFYRQLKIVCLDEYVCSGREEDSALLSSIPQVELVSSRQAIRHDTHDLYRELQTKLDSDYCTTQESLTLFIYDSHLFPPPIQKKKTEAWKKHL